jgi:hypothetical protein
MTKTEPNPDADTATPEERLRTRVSMLTQLLFLAGVIVILQFGIMVKLLIETPK